MLLTIFHNLIIILAVCMSFNIYSEGIENALSYHKNSKLQYFEAEKCLNALSFRDRELILDLGCGDGKITHLIAQKAHNSSVFGIDISESMIDLANSLYQKDNLEFLVDDATFPSFMQSFDKLFSFFSFHWLSEQDLALQCYQTLLKPGGILVLQMPVQSPERVSCACEKIAQSEKWKKYFDGMHVCKFYKSLEELDQLLSINGFEVMELKYIENTGRFDTVQDFENWVMPLITCASFLPEDKQKEFQNSVLNEMKTHVNILSNGQVERSYKILHAIAMKKV